MKILGCDIHDATVKEIGRFAILWNSFERFFCDNNCNPEKIREIANRVIIAKDTVFHFAEIVNLRRYWFGQDIEDYVCASLHPGNSRTSKAGDMLSMEKFLELDEGNMLIGCLLIVYRIRNNLMHGMKAIEELDGQVDLFQAANNVLEDIRWKSDC